MRCGKMCGIVVIGVTAICGCRPAARPTANTQATPAKPTVDLLTLGKTNLANANSLTVDVSATVEGTQASDTLHIVTQKPNKASVVWRQNDEPSGELVSDGRTFRQWDTQNETRATAPKDFSTFTPAIDMGLSMQYAGILILNPSAYAGIQSAKDIGPDTVDGVAARRYKAVYQGQTVTLTLGVADGLARQMSYVVGEQTMLFRFHDYHLNSPPDAKLFAALPPRGLQHVDAGPLMAAQPREGAGAPGTGAATPAGPADGSLAPDFTLPTSAGGSITLSKLRGKVVLIDFWATWCGPCQEELPHIQSLYQRFGKHGLQVLAVNTSDSQEAMTDFLRQHPEYTMSVLFDGGDGGASVALGKYGVNGIPHVYLINQSGRIAASYEGFDPSGEDTMAAAIKTLGLHE